MIYNSSIWVNTLSVYIFWCVSHPNGTYKWDLCIILCFFFSLLMLHKFVNLSFFVILMLFFFTKYSMEIVLNVITSNAANSKNSRDLISEKYNFKLPYFGTRFVFFYFYFFLYLLSTIKTMVCINCYWYLTWVFPTKTIGMYLNLEFAAFHFNIRVKFQLKQKKLMISQLTLLVKEFQLWPS